MKRYEIGNHDELDFSEAGGYIRSHIGECWLEDEDGHREFDWDAYQEMCDQADYWDMED